MGKAGRVVAQANEKVLTQIDHHESDRNMSGCDIHKCPEGLYCIQGDPGAKAGFADMMCERSRCDRPRLIKGVAEMKKGADCGIKRCAE